MNKEDHTGDTLICYADDSYSAESRFVTMGGYISTVRGWIAFEEGASEVYKKYDVAVFHAVDFRLTKNEFDGWGIAKKVSFVDDLFRVAKQTVISGVSFGVARSWHKSFQTFGGPTRGFSVQGTAFSRLVSEVCDGPDLVGLLPPASSDVGFTVESGPRNGEIGRFARRVLPDKMHRNLRIVSIDFATKSDCKAIHLADFWAMYSRRLAPSVPMSGSDFTFMQDTPPILHSALRWLPHLMGLTQTSPGRMGVRPGAIHSGLTRRLRLGPPGTPFAGNLARFPRRKGP